MRSLPLLTAAILVSASARAEETRPYSAPLTTTGTVVGAVGLASVVAGSIWTLAVLAGPTKPVEPCGAPHWCLFGSPAPQPAWDFTPGVTLLAVGGASLLVGAALALVGAQRVHVEHAGTVAVAF